MDRPDPLGKLEVELDILAERTAKQPHAAAHELVDLEQTWPKRLLAGERQQPVGELRTPNTGIERLVQELALFGLVLDPIAQEVEVADDAR